MNSRIQAACALAGLVGVTLVLVGLITADYLPPPHADWTPNEFAEFYRDESDRIRTGVLILFIGSTGWATMVAAASVQLRKAGQSSAAVLQTVAGTAVYVLLVLFCVFLAAAAFRPERNGELTAALHDVGWFMAFLAAPSFALQSIAVGVGVLSDRSPTPAYPRWLGYAGVWVAILLLPGTILLYFHDGIFAYHGVISYWIPVFTFGGWMGLLSLMTLVAARTAPAEEKVPVPA